MPSARASKCSRLGRWTEFRNGIDARRTIVAPSGTVRAGAARRAIPTVRDLETDRGAVLAVPAADRRVHESRRKASRG